MAALLKNLRIINPQSQQGTALIIAVMILLVLTVIGIYAVGTSILETKIAGSERVLKDAFYAADGGVDCGRNVIALFITELSPTLPSGTSVSDAAQFRDEITGTTAISPLPYVTKRIGDSDTKIDIDRIKAEEPTGFSSEFGAPVSEKKTSIYYGVDSTSTGIANASSEIRATYRYVLQ